MSRNFMICLMNTIIIGKFSLIEGTQDFLIDYFVYKKVSGVTILICKEDYGELDQFLQKVS